VSKKESRRSHGKRARHRRTFTARGNPEVTRAVATELISEKLPDLANLAGLPEAPESSSPVSSKPVALNGITGNKALDTYQDSELDDREDPDHVSQEDEQDLEDLPDDINVFYKEFTSYMASLNGESFVTDNGVDKQVMMATIVDWLGTRYLFGGMGRQGIDCSAFTGMLYRTLNFKLPRTAAAQYDVGIPVDTKDLQFGDLIFFHTREAVYVSHVGVYLGNGMFAHASSRNGVTVSSIESDYYASHLIGGRRYDLNRETAAVGIGASALAHN
jgi:cell wall-associated NlpC family hydrolase